MQHKNPIHIVWFKRDLRIIDHEPIKNALHPEIPTLFLYLLEPIILNDAHYSERHFIFIKQSLSDLNEQLAHYQTCLLNVEENALEIFETLDKKFDIKHVFSYQETGLGITFKRDIEVGTWLKIKNIPWTESVQNGVQRGLRNRREWKDTWVDFMNQPLDQPDFDEKCVLGIPFIKKLENDFKIINLNATRGPKIQRGGTSTALKYLNSFLAERINGYNTHYSKPLTSRKYSSRLSPYIAWGNLSVRMVVKKAAQLKSSSKVKNRVLDSFLSRLRWQAHFIQKFEMEPAMEYRSVHKAYRNLDKEIDPVLQKAWREGKTGYPLVDAGMRCLNATGFVNFRLRALLMSFFTHHLWQPWQDGSAHLAQQFLDFEPGIHYPQLQMQAGETGINIVRVYSPVKNSLEHDPEALFLKKWLPELAHLPLPYIHEPWKITAMERQLYNFRIDRDYVERIVEVTLSRKRAQNTLYGIQKAVKSRQESQRIIAKHTNPNREIWPGATDIKTS
jgi:deoxyribodipyrimidine photo-lyase